MDLILAAHGTRKPGGVAMVGDLAAQVSALLDRRVQVAFVDVLGPTPSEVLSRVAASGRPADRGAGVLVARLSRAHRPARPCHGQRAPECQSRPRLGAQRGGRADSRRSVGESRLASGRFGDPRGGGHHGLPRARRPAHHRDDVVRAGRIASAAGIRGHRRSVRGRRGRRRSPRWRTPRRGCVLSFGRRSLSTTPAGQRRRFGQPTAGYPSRAGPADCEPIPQGRTRTRARDNAPRVASTQPAASPSTPLAFEFDGARCFVGLAGVLGEEARRGPRRLIFAHIPAILAPCPGAKSHRVGSLTRSRRCSGCHSAHRSSSTESSPVGSTRWAAERYTC